jgi:aromatic ring-opening dioxygenase catalytic subunit (LigB family)
MSYHNLRALGDEAASTAFHRWLDGALGGDADHRRQELSAWDTAPSARASHPREEHLLPLMVASGSGGDRPATKLWAGAVGSTPVAAWAFD